jgi:hypothetical protein
MLGQEEPEMVCEHLSALEQQMLSAGLRVTFRGQAWSRNCREWVYFDCLLDRAAIRERIEFASCVKDHEHLGTHDGQEAGFVCEECHDAVMGVHRQSWRPSTPVYRGAPATGCT